MFNVILSVLLAQPAFAGKENAYTALRVDVGKDAGLCPGTNQQLDIFATDAAKGKETKVKFGDWKELDITWDIGPVSPKGVL